MNWKILVFIGVVVALAALFIWGGIGPETAEQTPQMPEGHQAAAMESTESLPTITKAVVTVKEVDGEEETVVHLPAGEAVPLEGSNLQLRLGDFYSHWNWDSGPINRSFNLVNPSAKIEVLDADGELLYSQWAFEKVPYFNMSTHGGGDQGKDVKALTFTLMAYEGLDPDPHAGHDHAPGEGHGEGN